MDDCIRQEQVDDGNWYRLTAPVVGLVAIVAVYAVLVVGAVQARGHIWHDEAASVLAATGHQDDWYEIEFGGAAPYGEWAPAAELQALLEVDRPFDLQGVSRSLADRDFHPPLFYWFLHLTLLLGVPLLWAGPVINIVFGGILAVAVFFFVLRLTRSTWAALAAVAASTWSPAIVLAGAEARHYLVLALMVVALGFVAERMVGSREQQRSPSTGQLVAFGTVTALGMLTHHQFIVFATIAGVIVWIAGYTRRWGSALKIGGALIAGVAIATVVFPYLIPHSARLQSILPALSLDVVPGRMSRWVTRMFDVVSLDRGLSGLFRLLSRLLIIATALIVITMRRPVTRWARRAPEQATVVALSVATLTVPGLAYALQRAPDHALGVKYVGALWPLAVVALTTIALTAHRRGWVPIAALAGVVLISTVQWITLVNPDGEREAELLAGIAAADAVVTDCASRGYFPTVADVLDPTTPVYLATGEDLRDAVFGGWTVPRGDVYFLHASCPGAGDVFGAFEEFGIRKPARVGTLERYEVWRWSG